MVLNPVNRLVLVAQLLEISAPRYTPAGIPVADVLLQHTSEQLESGHTRTVNLYLKAVGFGAVAERLRQLALGGTLEFQGFLTQSRHGKSVVLHIQDFTYS